MADSKPPTNGHTARLLTLLPAKAAQLAGLYFGLKELSQDQVRESALIFCAFLILGIEGAQEALMRMIDRLLGDTNR